MRWLVPALLAFGVGDAAPLYATSVCYPGPYVLRYAEGVTDGAIDQGKVVAAMRNNDSQCGNAHVIVESIV